MFFTSENTQEKKTLQHYLPKESWIHDSRHSAKMGLFSFRNPLPITQMEPTQIQRPRAPSPSPFSTPTVETPIKSREYNSNYLSRKSTLAAIRLYEPRSRPDGMILNIPYNRVVKYGRDVQLAEAAALRFVAKNTTIPVPKVYYAFEHKHVKYIVMDRIDGEEIGKGWSERPEGERTSLLRQLKGYFDQLRNIPHPRPGIIAAVDMQKLYEPRTYKGREGFGPFAKEVDFNQFLRFGIQKEDGFFEATGDNSCITDEERICFTHGDASSSNILVKNGKIVAMIDFELSGFYPEYWEYTCAMNVNSQDGFWKAEIGKFLDTYPMELEIEETRRKHFGPRGLRGRYAWA
ncbi:hypothetical protein LOCC1_G008237 [Lachnellula occidentalis]|uniref:Aminoglycoside phosphotransferase domain-containing protein n=1 Tax=Lachnellula occidentalis TaxID=215460 RepID=A0A8H8U9G4_9HELO|nr:hypothetical protein LOCC1_G008237 [Lachnellula occidentalis]